VLLIPALAFPLITYMADRCLYAPSLGFCWILGAGIVALAGRVKAEPGRTAALVALTAIPFTFFAARTRQYQGVWRNGESLWTYTTEKSRDFRALNNLAQVRLDQQRYAEAERFYGQASKFDNIVSWQGLATVYYNTKRYEEAQRAIERAVAVMLTKRSSPDEQAELYYTKGAIEWVRGQNDAAARIGRLRYASTPTRTSKRPAPHSPRQPPPPPPSTPALAPPTLDEVGEDQGRPEGDSRSAKLGLTRRSPRPSPAIERRCRQPRTPGGRRENAARRKAG
jgi:hypothetical protein